MTLGNYWRSCQSAMYGRLNISPVSGLLASLTSEEQWPFPGRQAGDCCGSLGTSKGKSQQLGSQALSLCVSATFRGLIDFYGCLSLTIGCVSDDSWSHSEEIELFPENAVVLPASVSVMFGGLIDIKGRQCLTIGRRLDVFGSHSKMQIIVQTVELFFKQSHGTSTIELHTSIFYLRLQVTV